MSKGIAERIGMAMLARDWLIANGCMDSNTRFYSCRPLIEISNPPIRLLQQAVRITECVNGVTRSVWAVNLKGCRIIWR